MWWVRLCRSRSAAEGWPRCWPWWEASCVCVCVAMSLLVASLLLAGRPESRALVGLRGRVDATVKADTVGTAEEDFVER